MLGRPPDGLCVMLVRTAGLEPARPIGQKILSLQRLPFRHVRNRRADHIPALSLTAYARDHKSLAVPLRLSLSRISLPGLK